MCVCVYVYIHMYIYIYTYMIYMKVRKREISYEWRFQQESSEWVLPSGVLRQVLTAAGNQPPLAQVGDEGCLVERIGRLG